MSKKTTVQGIVDLPIDQSCGIYYLKIDDEIVYIGKSSNLFARITNHMTEMQCGRSDKVFTHISVVWCSSDEVDHLESSEILTHRPPLNKTFNPKALGLLTEKKLRNVLSCIDSEWDQDIADEYAIEAFNKLYYSKDVVAKMIGGSK